MAEPSGQSSDDGAAVWVGMDAAQARTDYYTQYSPEQMREWNKQWTEQEWKDWKATREDYLEVVAQRPQGIYAKREDCPCHGGHQYFTRSNSPANWKLCKTSFANDSALKSLAAQAIGWDPLWKLWTAAEANPQTAMYKEHVYLIYHKTKTSGISVQAYCNGCRSQTQLYSPVAALASEAEELKTIGIFTDILMPYKLYFDKLEPGAPFSSHPPPQPSGLKAESPENCDFCFFETEKLTRYVPDDEPPMIDNESRSKEAIRTGVR